MLQVMTFAFTKFTNQRSHYFSYIYSGMNSRLNTHPCKHESFEWHADNAML